MIKGDKERDREGGRFRKRRAEKHLRISSRDLSRLFAPTLGDLSRLFAPP
jgi:hypothetical protein